MRDRQRYLAMRSVIVTPLLDEEKWQKVPRLECDAVLLDLEDTAPPDRKSEALEKALSVYAEPDKYPGMTLLPRPNPIRSATGRDEIAAFSRAGAQSLCCPMTDSVESVLETIDCARSNGADPDIFAVIETAAGLRTVEDVCAIPEVCGVFYGPGDLMVDADMDPIADDGSIIENLLLYSRSKIVVAAAAEQIARFDNTFTHNLKDTNAVRHTIEVARRLGFTGVSTFYAPFISLINDCFLPSAEAVAAARKCVELFESAMAEGATGYQEGGRAVVVHDYKRAQTLLQRAAVS